GAAGSRQRAPRVPAECGRTEGNRRLLTRRNRRDARYHRGDVSCPPDAGDVSTAANATEARAMNRDDMLRASLRQLPVPDVSPDLLHRIVRSRVMGVRTSLHGRRWSVPWGRIAAAAFILAFLTGSWQLPLTFSRMGQSRLNRDRVKEFLRTTIPWASSGDEGRALSDKPPAPTHPLISVDSLDLSRLTEGTWTYRSSVTTDEVLTAPAGHSRIHLARVTFQSRAMWILMMAHSRDSASWGPYGDTTYLDPES